MACWSPENATKAYITTLKMERKEKEPNAAEFISALSAGNNAQVMVAAFGPTTKMVLANLLALVAAAHQTGGRVICIVPTHSHLLSAKRALRSDAKLALVEFVVGNVHDLLMHEYMGADFFLLDCGIEDYERIVRGLGKVRTGEKMKGGVLVGFNAFCKGSGWQWGGLGTHLLPIGDGILVTRIDQCNGGEEQVLKGKDLGGRRKRNWVVKVDQCTGEEHVFRVRSSHRKVEIAAL